MCPRYPPQVRALYSDAVLNGRGVEVGVRKTHRCIPLLYLASDVSQALLESCDELLWLFLREVLLREVPQWLLRRGQRESQTNFKLTVWFPGTQS